MVKHTQKIHRQFADELFSVFGHFGGLVLKGLTMIHERFFSIRPIPL